MNIEYLPWLRAELVCSVYRLYKVTVANIMKTDLQFITRKSTYRELKELLGQSKLTSFPLVDNKGKVFIYSF